MRLPRVPNRSETYYKITNEKECHYDLQYHDGLIVDTKSFDDNPKHSCAVGGIYFTTKEHIHKFFEYGKWIRPVTIPEDARVIFDPEGDKYRADRLFFHSRENIEFYFTDLFDKKTFPKQGYHFLTEHCSEHFDIWFNKKTFPGRYYWRLVTYCSKYFNI